MAKRPNLLVVLSDQLRRQALSCYGDPNIETTHIDALASRGVTFNNACSTYPICVPFRFTMMTGEYAHGRQVPGIEWRMSPREVTLADEFNDAGYDTVYVGKWHLDGGHGRQGFDNAKSCNMRPVPRHRQGRWRRWLGFELRNGPFDTAYFEDGDPTPKMIDGYQTDGLFDLAMNEMKQRANSERPFCCVLSVEPPHPPYEAPHDLTKQWLLRDIELPPNFMGPHPFLLDEDGKPQRNPESRRADLIKQRQIYYAMVENLDQNMGRLDAFLRDNSLRENTIVVFLADHGEFNGAHSLVSKQFPHEESAGIPLIVAGPSLPQGERRDDPTCTEDLFPTFLGLCGLTPRPDLPGADLTPLIRGSQDRLDREGVMLEFVAELRAGMVFHDRVYRGFRTRDWSYAVLGNGHGLEPWYLHHLAEDPCQMNNLVNDPAHRATATRLHGLLRSRMAETHDDIPLKPAFGHDAYATRVFE